MYLTNTCKILSVSFVFHKKKHIRELRLKQKIDFIIKKSYFRLWSTAFLGICQLSGTWGHCAPLISTTDLSSFSFCWIGMGTMLLMVCTFRLLLNLQS